MNVFDEKYYEDGIANHVSGYENYRWMPERTIREATSIISNVNFDTVLDFGCAKGFMVYDCWERARNGGYVRTCTSNVEKSHH